MERIFSTSNRARIAALAVSSLLALSACGSGGDDKPATATTTPAPAPNPAPAPAPAPTPTPPPEPEPPSEEPVPTLFETVTDSDWDETAVRKVLVTFAFGGQASDAQIEAWADMAPDAAIVEMLTFDEHNFRLSPPSPLDSDRLWDKDGSLQGLSDFWQSSHPDNVVKESGRDYFRSTHYTWTHAAISRGLNPFRQKIGYWETNFHLAANIDAGIQHHQMYRYYDDVLGALEERKPYQQVLATAASSAAIAMQYGHRFNVWADDACECNEDFAREFHQLFFGIRGEINPDYHELVTIKNTAKAFTGMPVVWYADIQELDDVVTFGSQNHAPGALDLLDTTIGGTNARERITLMSETAINNSESAANLPVIIIGGLADDNLTPEKIAAIRQAWAAMPVKELLSFLRAYAISDLFHNENRVKFLNSVDRHILLQNMMTNSNEENYLAIYNPMLYENDGTKIFHPEHNVFGGQAGIEAADSPDVFRNRYNSVTEEYSRLRAVRTTSIDGVSMWEKDWASVAPRDASERFSVSAIAEWLWQRFVADGLKNYGPIERAHLYSLLATKKDLAELISPEQLERVFTGAELASDPELVALIDALGTELLALDSTDEIERLDANRRVGQAINFIVGTPYVFAQEGR